MARVVIVSNRVPVPSERGPRAGGLAVALKDVIKTGGLWFGWSGVTTEKTGTTPNVVTSDGTTYATIALNKTDYEHYYVGFSNSTLWPLLHSRLGLMKFDRTDYEGYIAVNRQFAAALAPLLADDDLIWVHDYHLIPLAAELRKLGVRNRIGFFLHVPFVSANVFGSLPRAGPLLRMLCAYNVIGFQTAGYVREFLESAHEIAGARIEASKAVTADGSALVIANPIGIDSAGFAAQAARAAKSAETKRLRESLAGRALIIGVDRLDYSKGLENRFRAFARLLANFPELRMKVSYLQVAATSREDVRQYRDLRRELDALVGDINGRFAEFDWVPLRYMRRPVARNTLAGFYRIARVGLVTPLRDGMNLVAKEYVAAQDPADPGVLVLSRFAGAAEEMRDALIVNPYDADEIMEAMRAALAMPLTERQARFERLAACAYKTTAESYCRNFLSALAEPGKSEQQMQGKFTVVRQASGPL